MRADVAPRPGSVRVTANLFGIPFGLAGLATVWTSAPAFPRWPAAVLLVLTAAVWLALLVAWVWQLRVRPLTEEIADPVAGPFLALIPTVLVLLGTGATRFGLAAGPVAVVVGTALALALGGWITGEWIASRVRLDSIHPGWYLPTVAGPLVSGGGLGAAGWPAAGFAVFSVGLVSTLVVGVVIRARLILGSPLPTPLVPTLAIEVAPPAVAGNAYVLITGGDRVDTLMLLLAGNAVLFVVVQLRLVGLYRSLRFSAGSWAFSFSYASVAAFALHGLDLGEVPGRAALSWVIAGLATAGIGWLVVRSLTALSAGTFLPRW